MRDDRAFTFSALDSMANEKLFVRCYDVPGVFLHTESDENLLMVLREELAEMMVHTAPYSTLRIG